MSESSAAKPSGVRRLTKVLLWIAIDVAVMAYPIAYALDRAAGRDVVLLAGPAYDAAGVKQRRAEFDDSIKDPDERRKAVAELYGPTTKAEVLRVLFVDDAQVIRPTEDPSLALVPPASGGGRWVQSASAFFAAKIAVLVAGAAAVALLILRRFLK